MQQPSGPGKHGSSKLEAFQPQHGHPKRAQLLLPEEAACCGAYHNTARSSVQAASRHVSLCQPDIPADLLTAGLAGHQSLAAAEQGSRPASAIDNALKGCSCACVLIQSSIGLLCERLQAATELDCDHAELWWRLSFRCCVSRNTPAEQPANRTRDQGSNQQLIHVTSKTQHPAVSHPRGCSDGSRSLCLPFLLPGPAC